MSVTDQPQRHIVIDTNVLISAALLPQSTTARALTLAVERFVIAQNALTWRELETRIARPKFDRYFAEGARLRHLVRIAQSMQRFEIRAKVKACQDQDDDKFVGLALDAQATIIITGDADLAVLKRYQEIDILSPAQFLQKFSVT